MALLLGFTASARAADGQGELLLQRIRVLQEHLQQLQTAQAQTKQQLGEQDRRQWQYQLGEFASQLKNLQATVEALEQRNAQLLTARHEAETRMQALTDALALVKNEAVNDRTRFAHREQQLTQQLQGLSAVQEDLLRDDAQLVNALHTGDRLLAQASQQLEPALEGTQRLTRQVTDLTQQVTAQARQLAQQSLALQQAAEDSRRWHTQASELTGAKTTLERHVSEQHLQLEQLTAAHEDTEQRLHSAQQQLEQQTQQLARLSQSVEQKDATLAKLIAQLEATTRAKEDLAAQLTYLQMEVARLESAVTESARTQAALSENREALQQDVKRLQAQLQEALTQQATLAAQATARKEVLEANAQQLTQELATTTETLKERSAQLDTVRQEFASLRQDHTALRAQVDQLPELKVAHVRLSDSRDALQRDVERLQAQWQDAVKQHAALTAQSSAREESGRQKIAELTQQLALAKQTTEVTTGQLASTKDQLMVASAARQVLEVKLEALATLKQEQGALTERAAQLTSRLAELTAAREQDQQQLKTRAAEAQQTRQQLEQLHKENLELTTRVHEWEYRLAASPTSADPGTASADDTQQAAATGPSPSVVMADAPPQDRVVPSTAGEGLPGTVAYNLGVIYQQSGLDDLAIHKYQEALTRNPRDHDASFNAALVYLRQGHVEPAAHVLEAAVQRDAADAQAHLLLALLYRDQLHQTVQAQAHYDMYRRLVPAEVTPTAEWLVQSPAQPLPSLRGRRPYLSERE